MRKPVRVMKAADRRGNRNECKYKKAEAYHLMPQDVKRPDDTGKNVLNQFPRGTTHATFSVANGCYRNAVREPI